MKEEVHPELRVRVDYKRPVSKQVTFRIVGNDIYEMEITETRTVDLRLAASNQQAVQLEDLAEIFKITVRELQDS